MKDKSSEDSSRAREEQEDFIIRLMLAGRWYGGRTAEELSKQWGIHPRTVHDRALVASGIIRRRGKPIEEFIDQKLAELETLQAAAMDEVKWFKVGDGLVSKPAHNVPAAIKSIELQAQIRGAMVKRIEKREPLPTNPEDLRAMRERVVEALEELDRTIAEQVSAGEQRH